MISVVTGRRKREIDLDVPAKFIAYTENKNHEQKLVTKLQEKQSFGICCT